jgi:hypothetical protein
MRLLALLQSDRICKLEAERDWLRDRYNAERARSRRLLAESGRLRLLLSDAGVDADTGAQVGPDEALLRRAFGPGR